MVDVPASKAGAGQAYWFESSIGYKWAKVNGVRLGEGCLPGGGEAGSNPVRRSVSAGTDCQGRRPVPSTAQSTALSSGVTEHCNWIDFMPNWRNGRRDSIRGYYQLRLVYRFESCIGHCRRMWRNGRRGGLSCRCYLLSARGMQVRSLPSAPTKGSERIGYGVVQRHGDFRCGRR